MFMLLCYALLWNSVSSIRGGEGNRKDEIASPILDSSALSYISLKGQHCQDSLLLVNAQNLPGFS